MAPDDFLEWSRINGNMTDSQSGPGLNGPTSPTNMALVPSMSHIATAPLSPCQRMSDYLRGTPK
jgi:hypothetical protein